MPIEENDNISLGKNEEGEHSEIVKSDDAAGVEETAPTRTEISARIRSLLVNTQFENIPIERFKSRLVEVQGKQLVREACPSTQAWTTQSFGGKGWGKTQFTISATLEDVAAYFWEFEKVVEDNSDLVRAVEERHGWEMHVVKRYKVDAADHSYHHQRQLRNIIQLHKIDKVSDGDGDSAVPTVDNFDLTLCLWCHRRTPSLSQLIQKLIKRRFGSRLI